LYRGSYAGNANFFKFSERMPLYYFLRCTTFIRQRESMRTRTMVKVSFIPYFTIVAQTGNPCTVATVPSKFDPRKEACAEGWGKGRKQ